MADDLVLLGDIGATNARLALYRNGALGPGSGLGVACYVPVGRRGVVLASEGGHSSLPASCEREDRVIGHLRARFGHVSCERALSGPGLENLYSALAVIDGDNVPQRDA